MPVPPFLSHPVPFLCDAAVAGHPPTPGQWALVCGAILTILYLVLRSGRRKKADPLATTPSQASLAQQRSVERQMQNLLVELSEMARQITAQLDTRSTKLALLIDDADDKAARLQRLLDDCGSALATAAAPPPPLVADEPPALRPEVEPSVALPDDADPRHRPVYALADGGLSPADIARRLDRPHGEIELILALRPR